MFDTYARSIAHLIATDKKDEKRISNKARMSLSCVPRDDRFIMKNGRRVMCRYHYVKGDMFPVWLVEMLSGHRDSGIGIYIKTRGTTKSDVSDKLLLAADCGFIPEDMRHVAIISDSCADSALEYAQRAQELLERDIQVVHDERSIEGGDAADAIIPADTFKKVKLAKCFSPRRVWRMTNEDTLELDAEILRMYRQCAEELCRDVMSDMIASGRFWSFSNKLNGKESSEYINAISCGRVKADFHMEGEYENEDENAALSRWNTPPQDVVLNASHNIPFSGSVRSLAFSNTDDLIKQMRACVRAMEALDNITSIWKSAHKMDTENGPVHKMKSALDAVAGGDKKKTSHKLSSAENIAKIARTCGVEEMIDAYYSGVPVEDVCA